MRNLISLGMIICIAMTILSCSSGLTEDQKFEKMAGGYIERYLELNPERATSLGDHRFDNRLNNYSLDGYNATLTFQKAYQDSLKRIDPNLLSEVNRIDFKILQHRIEKAIFSLEVLREFEWNPRVYNIGDAIYDLIARDFAPLPHRILNLKERLLQVPQVVEAAKTNLHNPPAIFTETAIRQNVGTISLVKDLLEEFVRQVPELQTEIDSARALAITALEGYGEWLEKDLLPRSHGDFRLGEDKFRKKLKYTLETEITVEEILQRAQSDLITTQEELYQTARLIHLRDYPNAELGDSKADKKALIQLVLNKLADDHPDNSTIVSTIEKTLEETRQFVLEKNLVTVPDDPINIIVMPEFQRGVASAYCDSPGPLDKGQKTFYAVSPAPADWPQDLVISSYREDNNYMLHDLTIHEAMPGHYLQLAHANRFQAPTMVRIIFSSGPFIEGWATYAEQVMVAHGYGGPEVKSQQLKMRLRVIINAIIDQQIHAAGMTEEEAMKLMIEEGYQEEGEAAAKWRRACLTSTQLSTYYIGNLGLNDLRKTAEKRSGDQFKLKEFNDQVISYGSPPIKHLKTLMGLD